MTEQEPITVVVFRKFKDTGHIIALFPEIPATYTGDTCDSYMRVGEHSAASYVHVISRTYPATDAEYIPLKRLLESEPFNYRFKVLKKAGFRHHQNRRTEAARVRKAHNVR